MAWKKDLNQDAGDDGILVSRINAAGIINITLENLWRDSYLAMANGNLVLWNRKLDAIWVMLGGDVKKDSPDDVEMKKIDMNIYKTGGLSHKPQGFGKIDSNEATTISLQYLYLKDKGLFLRRLQNKQGKGTAYSNEDDSDFD